MKKYQFLIYSLFCLGIIQTKAQYTVLHTFNDSSGGPTGSLTLSGKVLYGASATGGSNNDGCIFRIDTNGNNYKDIFDFDSAKGRWPIGSLTLYGKILYGATGSGGANNMGLIFAIDTAGTGYKDLYNFNGIYNSYSAESSGLILNGKVLYGVTEVEGAYNEGSVFSIDTDGSGFKNLFDFGGYNGALPSGSLILSGGKLYGTTYEGGTGTKGVVFSMDTNGSRFKDLYNFNFPNNNVMNGPIGPLTLSDGTLYGVTLQGGFPNNFGNIFSIDTSGNGYKDLFDFNGISNGKLPMSSLTLSGGLLYGSTSDGTPNKGGNIYSIDTNGSGFTELFDFDGTNGQNPYGDLILSGNTLFGMTGGGGTYNKGVIFKIDTSTRYVTSVNNISATNGEINVYPNPTSQNVTVQTKLLQKQNVEFILYNAMGQIVYAQSLSEQSGIINQEIDLSLLANGVYLLKVNEGDKYLTQKIVKQN